MIIVYCTNMILADKVCIADGFIKRFFGLMGKKSLANGEGLLLLNSPSIHCFFMKIPIDAIYLSKDMKVLGTETVKPWHIGKHCRKTVHVLELKEGSASKVNVGDTIYITEKKGGVICYDR